jgi:Family of unknown function (DUF5677)
MMLPFENDVRHEIETAFKKELAEARELLRLALDMLGSDGNGNLTVPSTRVPGVGDWARLLALGLHAKACKQFRTIIMVGEAGFGGEMTVLTRSLFETALAIEFIMKERVVLKRDGNEIDIDPSRPLTTDFRAQLYGARVALLTEKRLKDWDEYPELKEIKAILGNPADVAVQAAVAKSAVGEAWWKALKKGLAGLTVKALADSLGVLGYYVMIYGDQSEVAHAGDGFSHFDVADDGSHGRLDLSPSPDNIGRGLRLACLIFLGCLTSVHNRLQFGPTVDSVLDAFAARLGVPSHR